MSHYLQMSCVQKTRLKTIILLHFFLVKLGGSVFGNQLCKVVQTMYSTSTLCLKCFNFVNIHSKCEAMISVMFERSSDVLDAKGCSHRASMFNK